MKYVFSHLNQGIGTNVYFKNCVLICSVYCVFLSLILENYVKLCENQVFIQEKIPTQKLSCDFWPWLEMDRLEYFLFIVGSCPFQYLYTFFIISLSASKVSISKPPGRFIYHKTQSDHDKTCIRQYSCQLCFLIIINTRTIAIRVNIYQSLHRR